MTSGQLPSAVDIAGADNETLTTYYSEFIGESSWRHQEEHARDLGPVPEDADRPLATFSREALLQFYAAVHDEMMKRHRETPGIWGP